MKKTLRVIGNILRHVVLVVAALIIGVNLYLWNAGSLLGDQLPMPFGYGMAVVLTGSMGDALPADSLIIVKEQYGCEIGEIVVYQSGRSLVVHRVIALEEDHVITKGDANNTQDEPVAMSSIRGVVVGKIPHVGTAVRWLKTPMGMICVIAIAILLIEASHLQDKKEKEAERQRIRKEIRALQQDRPEHKEDN